jgi:prepilin-type N-terminal cleavage/methylation domain-containing protein
MSTLRTRRTTEAGFTLVELLVSMAVSALILGGAVYVTTQVQQGYGQQLDTAASEQEARYALDWIQRLLRQAGSDPYNVRTQAESPCLPGGLLPSVNGFPPVMRDPNHDGVNNDIEIFSDANPPNGAVGGPGPVPTGCTEAGEDMTISWKKESGDLVGKITLTDNNRPTAGAVTMTDDVVNSLDFKYFDRFFNPAQNPPPAETATMATLAWVRVTVTTQGKVRDRQTGGFPTYTLSVDVRLRPRW